MKRRPRTGLDDTSREDHRVQIEALRRMTPEERFELGRALTAAALDAAWRAVREANPEASEVELKVKFVEMQYGRELAEKVRVRLLRDGG